MRSKDAKSSFIPNRAKWHVTKECEFREELETKREPKDDSHACSGKLKPGEVILPLNDGEIIPAGTATEMSDEIMKQIMDDIFGDTSDIDQPSPCQEMTNLQVDTRLLWMKSQLYQTGWKLPSSLRQ
jgi:hypothetical protein